MLSVNEATIRLFLHVLAATLWVGGQLTLAALVPVLRRLGADAPKLAARQFNRVAWSAFVVLVGTGVWNMIDAHTSDRSSHYRMTLDVKLAVVVVSGLAAYLHLRARSRRMLAVYGALTAVSALAALFLGMLLTTG